ncbi:MAG: cupin domain-containing protein [Desulfuromonadales bacterium]|nr:cupin domain-containing protein [Desulfuromonadales bacterium]MBN2791559.1 cupin domain-containing protein [Desulfuromonadales bacterium]
MFKTGSESGYKQPLGKIAMKTLVYGDNTLMVEFRLQNRAMLPSHSHPHEQTGYLISGKLEVTIDEQTFLAVPGDSWCIKGGAKHSAAALTDSVVIEVFSPVREDYLP